MPRLVTRSKWSCAPAAGWRGRETQAARHAQVQQQQAFVQVEQQVLAAPPHAAHGAADQPLGRQPQRPAQRLAQAHRLDPGAGDAVGKTQACDFDFGQFRHAGIQRQGLGLLWFDEAIPPRGRRAAAGLGPGRARRKSAGHRRGRRAEAPPPRPRSMPNCSTSCCWARLNARGTEPAAGYSLILDAARKTNDPALYQRAVDIAFQARSGDAALQAARAWKQAHPALARSQSLRAADPGRAQPRRRQRRAAEDRTRAGRPQGPQRRARPSIPRTTRA